MKKYTYIHFLMHKNAVIIEALCRLIQQPENRFDTQAHAFVTPFQNVYDALSGFENVYYSPDESHGAKTINRYGKYGDVLIVHSMPSVMQALRIKKSLRHKIIWRTWGHDIALKTDESFSVKNVGKKILNWLWRLEVRSFIGVGVANTVDEINVEKHFGNVKTFALGYSLGSTAALYEKLKQTPQEPKDHVNILVGHSAYAADNHIAIIEKLKRFAEDGKVRIFLILSYGDQKYADGVIAYVESNRIPNVEIIRNFMDRDRYIAFLNTMDIAVFDSRGSYALGNIAYLLNLGKKLYLNEDGVIAGAFEKDHIPFGKVSRIGDDFERLVAPFDYESCKQSSLFGRPYEEQIRLWHEALEYALKSRG